MRSEHRAHLSYVETVIALTDRERATLRRASELAAEIRERARVIRPEDWADDPADVTLAHVEHDAGELAADGYVSVESQDLMPRVRDIREPIIRPTPRQPGEDGWAPFGEEER